MKTGLQLYTLRAETARDFEGVLRRVAELGYAGVEFAGDYGGLEAADLKAKLEELNLETASLHISLDALETDFDQQADLASELDTPYLVCPWVAVGRRADEAGWRSVFASLKGIAEKAAARGLTLAYHNHTFEFESKVGGEYALDALLSSAPQVQLELDVAWAQAGGVSGAEYLRRYAGRTPLVHIKDLTLGGAQPTTVALGEGVVDLTGVLDAARDLQPAWLLVEQDSSANPFKDIATSAAYMRAAGLLPTAS